MTKTDDVLFSVLPGRDGDLGIITLNRPSALNALNHAMTSGMYATLRQWETDSSIKAVVICAAEGRAFCAGGDLRLTYQRCLAHDANMTEFFREEYYLNHCIYHYSKPYIALLDGITFGGGVGISIHGSHRIATERLLFAMPETGIGFFPDVGGCYFLPRLPGYLGFYLGLTGARITSDDCVALGITQHKVLHDTLPALVIALAQQSFGRDPRADVSQVIEQFNVQVNPSALIEQRALIDDCFSLATMEEILSALQQTSQPFAKDTAAILSQKSPTSLTVSLRALQQGAELDFDACLQQDYRLATRFLLGHDFPEGIRAVIIDKDQTPHWEPSTLKAVVATDIQKYFSPLSKELFK